MINKKQLRVSRKLALVFLIVQLLLKILHFSSFTATASTFFAIFHGWLILLLLAGIFFYYILLTSIVYLGLRILNYSFNSFYR
ncbi:hypothetical protein LFYK43_15890 [Ligilactobacillus salitolerans]|uniref:Uncharacterized protein n=1 Tax=Ligilactobacillus salitolerans TaxID=1808352 RepID=A0A401IUA9_9LACO|nr:hypothetical protein [Ligilactobacillus salitolerans]GBG95130.1 hypothetical protein LFYK43_15890 [Ligilactobacillus salitolerans]